MKNNSKAYNEKNRRGSLTFPFDYHFIDVQHERFSMPFHFHIDHELIRINRGGLHLTLNENSYYLREGDYLLINDGIVHGGLTDTVKDSYDCVVFNLSAFYDEKKPSTLFLNKVIRHQVILDAFYSRQNAADLKICDEIDSLFDVIRENRPGRDLLAYGRMLTLLGYFDYERRYTQYNDNISSRSMKYLTKSAAIFRYIFENYTQDITLEDMSRSVALDPRYFCKFFKELTQSRPVDYLNKFRIENAAIRLTSTKEPISQIAYASGFKDPCYFTRLFKRYKQVSPKEFREAHMPS